MTAVAFLALALAVTVQSVRLQPALVREQRLRAEAELKRAQAEVQFRRARALVDQMLAGVAEQPRRAGGSRPIILTGSLSAGCRRPYGYHGY
jgi:hypothetical protein